MKDPVIIKMEVINVYVDLYSQREVKHELEDIKDRIGSENIRE